MSQDKKYDMTPEDFDVTLEPRDWYFTFGLGTANAKCYVVIHDTWSSARREMVRRYGEKWAFQYPSAEAAGVERWGLRPLEESSK
jgi:hypothetical protein